MHLRALGWDTRDSGDGKSKAVAGYEPGSFSPFAHVIVGFPKGEQDVLGVSRRLAHDCAWFTGESWICEYQCLVRCDSSGMEADAPGLSHEGSLFASEYAGFCAFALDGAEEVAAMLDEPPAGKG
jgi:hypothetical protein